jgi:hypothetical protein
MGKNQDRIRDEQPESYFLELRNHFLGLKYLNSLMRTRDPGWRQFGSGIRNKHPGSATLNRGAWLSLAPHPLPPSHPMRMARLRSSAGRPPYVHSSHISLFPPFSSGKEAVWRKRINLLRFRLRLSTS